MSERLRTPRRGKGIGRSGKGVGRRFEKCALCSRRSQERMELLFNYIFTNPGGHLSSLRLDIAMLFFFSNFFSSLFLSGPPRVKQLRIESTFLTSSQNLSPETYAML